MSDAIDQVRLNFSPQGVMLLNVILAIVMYGVALQIRVDDFRQVLARPKGPLVGLLAQFVLLPALTFVLISLLSPRPSIALGMIVVAACPGGNVSNFVTHLARGNTALSVSMTAVSSVLAILFTPLNIAFWGSLNAGTRSLLTSVDLDGAQLFLTVLLILGLPLALGMTTRARWPRLADKLANPAKLVSILALLAFVAVATAMNFEYLRRFGGLVFAVVAVHNAVALSSGYGIARALRFKKRDARAIAIEVGIQNSGLGLVLIFNFFGGLGGMAMVAAAWGIWHVVAGVSLASVWGRNQEGKGSYELAVSR